MARKKKTEETNLIAAPAEATAPTTEEREASEISPEIVEVKSRRKKTAAPEEPQVSAPVEAPARRKKAASLPSDEEAVEPAAPAQPKPRRQKAASPKAEPQPPAPVAAVVETPEKERPAPTVTMRKPRPRIGQPAAPAAAPVEEPKPVVAKAAPSDSGRRGRRQHEKPAPIKAAPVQPAPAAVAPTAPAEPEVDLGSATLLTFSFRSRNADSAAPAPAVRSVEPVAPEPVALEVVEETVPEAASILPPPRILRDDEDRDLSVALWRTYKPSAMPPQTLGEEPDDEPESDDSAAGGRRRRRRRGRPGSPEETGTVLRETQAVYQSTPAPASIPVSAPEPEPEPEPAPAAPTRFFAPIDAPQVVLRNGVPSLVIGQKVVPPLFFSIGPIEGADASQISEQVRMAAENGIHVFGIAASLEPGDEGVAAAIYSAKAAAGEVLKADPEARLILRLSFLVPADWSSRPSRGRAADPSAPSICDDAYWTTAGGSVEALTSQLLASEVGGRILGIHLDREEWKFAEDQGFDNSQASRRKFGEWLRHRYRNDVVSLRASWFDGKATFESVSIPDFAGRYGAETDFVRLDRRARKWVDYNLFLSDIAVERIVDLSYAVKKASGARFLVGASYGYTFEWSYPGSGHLSLGKLLRCPHIDYVAGPPSYKSREPGASGAFPWPIDSIALNGKLAVSEEDFRTSIGRGEMRQDNPVMRTPQALESAHWRGCGAALAHGGGLNWMDRNSLGWLNSRGIWERGQKAAAALNWRTATPMTDPDVALFIDERSLAYLSDARAFEELVQDVREAILRSGLSVGFYLLSDLAHREQFPEARVHVFVNAWDIRPEVRSAIKSRLQRDNKVLLWLYCAGLFEGGRESLERAREVTGIALRPQPFNSRSGTTLLNVREPLCRVLPDNLMAQGGTLEPSYFAIPEDAAVLGEYTQTGLASFVLQKFPKQGTNDEPWTSVFLGEPVVSPGLFRTLGQITGAHVWTQDDDVIHVRAPFLTLHCSGAGVRTLTLPDKWSCYDLIQRVWMPVENSNLRFLGLDGVTYSFLVGHRSEIEAILASPGATAVSEEEILAHQDNTIHWDSIKFDVPIMKLDEWVEESWSEELADDLLIKPSLIEEVDEEEAEQDRPSREDSRSSGKRRRRGKKKGGRPDPGQAAQDQAQTINFNFRKRE